MNLSSPPSYSGVLAAQSLVFSLVLVEQELLTIPVHLLIVGFLAQSLVFCTSRAGAAYHSGAPEFPSVL